MAFSIAGKEFRDGCIEAHLEMLAWSTGRSAWMVGSSLEAVVSPTR